MFLFLSDKNAPEISGLAIGILGVLVAFLITVVPWLIWQGGRDIYLRIKNGPPPEAPKEDRITFRDFIMWVRAGMPRDQKSKVARVDAGVPQFLNDHPPVFPGRNSRPRIRD